jgi:hypothetical protein
MAPRRLVPLTGFGGIALLVAGLASDTAPTSSWPDARIRSWYHDHGNGPWLTSAYLLAAAAPLLLAFTSDLRQRAASAGAGNRAQSLLLGAGIAFAVTVLTGAALYAAVPAARVFNKAPAPDPSTSRFLLGAAYGDLVMFSAFAAALLTATISVIGLRHGVLPRWLAIAGIPAAALMLANAVLPMGVITLWFVVASVTLVVRSAAQQAGTAAAAQVPGSAAALA